MTKRRNHEEIIEKYKSDNTFHSLVSSFKKLIVTGNATSEDIDDALYLAEQQIEAVIAKERTDGRLDS